MLRVCLNCYGTYTTDSVYQWDLNHNLEITGIDFNAVPSVHFCNKKSEEAIVVNVDVDGDRIIAPIPNALLMEPYDIIAYLYSFGDSDGKTIEVINIPLIKRPKPTDYTFTDNEKIMNFSVLDTRISQYIYEHNLECDEFKNTFYDDYNERLANGELNGPPGPKGDPGERGSKIYSGTSITGTETSGTIFSDSDVAEAILDDQYINIASGNMYKCVTPGAPDVAEWIYVGSIKNNDALISLTLGYMCKNLIKIVCNSTTMSGLTITVNEDQSITVNGTYTSPTGSTKTSIQIGEIVDLPIENAKYILSGCPSGGDGSYYLSFSYDNVEVKDSGEGAECTPSGDLSTCTLTLPSGVQFDNLTFYPMLMLTDIEDKTYEPYKENVDTRIENVEDELVNTNNETNTRIDETNNLIANNNAIMESTLGYTKKNLLPNKANSSTVAGLTFTVNDDKSIEVSGTTNSANNLNLGSGYYLSLKAGTYILSGMENVSGGTEMTIKVYDGTTIHAFLHAGSKSKTFTLSEDTKVSVFVNWNSTGITYSGTIYPMIRRVEITDGTYEPYVDDIDTRLNGELICQGTVGGGAVSIDLTPYRKITCYLYHGGYVFTCTIHGEMIADYETRRFISGYNKGYVQFNVDKSSIQIGGYRFDDVDMPNESDPFYVFGHK